MERKISIDRHSRSGILLQDATFRARISANCSEPHPLRIFLAKVLDHKCLELFMTFVIIANLGIVVVDTDSKVQGHPDSFVMAMLSRATLAIFVVEIGARLIVLKREFFHSDVNIFELGLVFIDCLCLSLEILVGDLPSLLALRVVRLVKLMRTLHILRNCKELNMIIYGFRGTLRALAVGCGVISLIIMLWSIVAIEAVGPLVQELVAEGAYVDCAECLDAFHSVGDVMILIFKHVIAGVDWSPIVVPLIHRHKWTAMFFIMICVTIELGFLNLLLSVIVENADACRRNEERLIIVQKNKEHETAKHRLHEMCKDMDPDDSGFLSCDEVLAGYDNNKEFFEMMHMMDVEREDMEQVFRMLDHDKSGDVEYTEFVEQLYKMQTQESHSLLMFIRYTVNECRSDISNMLDLLSNNINQSLQSLNGKVAEWHESHGHELQELQDNDRLDQLISQLDSLFSIILREFHVLRDSHGEQQLSSQGSAWPPRSLHPLESLGHALQASHGKQGSLTLTGRQSRLFGTGSSADIPARRASGTLPTRPFPTNRFPPNTTRCALTL